MPTMLARNCAVMVAALTISQGTLMTSAQSQANSPGVAALVKSKQALMQCKSYRLTMKQTDAHGTAKQTVMEVIPPKRYHFKNSTMEMIILPEGSYRLKNGHWQKLPMDMSKAVSGLVSAGGQMDPDTLKHTKVNVLGPAVWHGTPAMTYSSAYSDEDRKSNIKVWIRVSDSLPLHMEGTVQTSIDGKTMSGTSHIESDYDYTTPISIMAPKTN